MCWLCFVGADSVRRGPWGRGLCVRRVSWEQTRYGVDRGGIMLVHGNGKIGVNNFTQVE